MLSNTSVLYSLVADGSIPPGFAVAFVRFVASAVHAIGIGHALFTVFACPTRFAPALLGNFTVTLTKNTFNIYKKKLREECGKNYVFRVASYFAHGNVAVDTLVVAQTRALKGFIDTTSELTAHPPFANGAVRPTPSRMAPKAHFRITLTAVFQSCTLSLTCTSRASGTLRSRSQGRQLWDKI